MDNSVTVNEDGDVSANIEGEYDIRMTQVSYVQPRVALEAALTDAEEYDRPSGFNNIRFGLRYRYELSREFAPYVGAYWNRSLGDKADQIRDQGGDESETGIVLGVRMWF